MSDVDTLAPRPAQVTPPETPSPAGLMGLAVGVVVVAALYFAQEVLVPITLAVLLSFVLAPLVDLLRRIRTPRLVAVLLSVAIALGIVLALGGVIGSQLAELASDMPRYQTTIVKKIDTIRGATFGRVSNLVSSMGREIERAGAPEAQPPAAASTPTTASAPEQKPVLVEVRQPNTAPLELAQKILSPVLHPLAMAGIIFIVTIFILLQQDDLRDRLIRLFGSRDLHRTTVAMDDAARRLSKFFLVQLGINASFGVIVGVGLYFIGIPSPLLWGTIGALMRFVPYIGSYVAAAVPLLIAAAVDPGWSMVLWTGALFLIVEPFIGQVVEPMLYGRSTGLSPISVIISAIFWGWLWGPIGLILSTPLTLCLVVLGRHVEHLEFLDVLFGDRPALTPVENFYQRVLANDPDEVQDHAELLLKERSLSSYYDEVALKGLQLAAHDVIRGVLTRPQLERIKDAVATLVEELDGYEDVDPVPVEADDSPVAPSNAERALPKQPAPDEAMPETHELPPAWRTEAPILCVAGRGPLDEAASIMLAQLLRKHGLGARVVAHEGVSRTGIGSLDSHGVAMICVSYLEISGAPSHLRFLLRRLRQRSPGARILVGLWPPNHAIMTEQRMQAMIGADDYVSTLRETVNACLKAAQDASEAADAPAAKAS